MACGSHALFWVLLFSSTHLAIQQTCTAGQYIPTPAPGNVACSGQCLCEPRTVNTRPINWQGNIASTSSGDYGNSWTCQWDISAPGQTITVLLGTLQSEYNRDFLTIQSCSSSGSCSNVFRESGDINLMNDIEIKITSHVRVLFTTSLANRFGGFSILWSSNGATSCVDCAQGKHIPDSTYPQCLDCPAGKYVSTTKATTCTDCAADTYSTTLGSYDSGSCLSCPENSQSPTGSILSNNCLCNLGFMGATCDFCWACVAGKYKITVGNSVCLDCDAGKYLTTTGATIASSCVNCGAGKYAAVAASIVCKDYDAGTYSAVASSVCTSCVAGKYSSTLRASTDTTCINCVAGTYSSTVRASTDTTCISCDAGTYSSVASSVCTDCDAGTYSAVASSVCTSCVAGKYSSIVRASTDSTCISCDAGKYSETVGASVASNCTDCVVNQYSEMGSTKCTSCPENTGHLLRAQSITACLCKPGYTGSNGGACTACTTGQYKPQEGSAS
jgi:hypothetical protein